MSSKPNNIRTMTSIHDIILLINHRIAVKMIIYVKTLKGKTITLDVWPHDIVGSVKERIEE
jgi:hypothetical protein